MDQAPYGQREKYVVTRADGKPVGRTFVIELDKDPQASAILYQIQQLYSATRPELASSLEPIVHELVEANVAKNGDRIVKIGCGSPGALHVMMEGLAVIGESFLDELERLELSGSGVWAIYKDCCNQDIMATMAYLKTGIKCDNGAPPWPMRQGS